ncbi:unnamed protein product [Gongylonema pulchrum]|uniref:Clathrin heavy chain n=1 Tax=Gongylonema pulchrum TaxID=637853 RepID=A0A183EQK2_9BILA|nr:unnamed protein product [Gongylonema pulchrum]
MRCYQSAHHWKGVVGCARRLNMERNEFNELLIKMIKHFEGERRFRDVAEMLLLLDEQSNTMKILEAYCEANAWDCAVDIASREEVFVKYVYERASARCDQILRSCEAWNSTLQQYSLRLETVRQKKKDSLLLAIERSANNDDSMSDVRY